MARRRTYGGISYAEQRMRDLMISLGVGTGTTRPQDYSSLMLGPNYNIAGLNAGVSPGTRIPLTGAPSYDPRVAAALEEWAAGVENIPRAPVQDESATRAGAVTFSPMYEETTSGVDPASLQFDPRQRRVTSAEYYRRQAAANPTVSPYSVVFGSQVNHPAIATESPDIQETRPAQPDQQRSYGEPQRAINDYNEERRLEYEERLRRAREIIARSSGTLNRGFDWAETFYNPYSLIQSAAGGGYLR